MSRPINLKSKVIEGAGKGPHLLVTGGVHGDEFESMGAIRRLIKDLDPTQVAGRITFVPVVNEAAYWTGDRFAEDGLDLARTCPGRPDGSISERTAHAISKLIRSVDYFIDLHSGGLIMRVAPMAGYTLHPDHNVLETQRRMARAFNLPIIWGTSSKLDGRTLSIARDAKVPSIYAEWMGSGECDPEGVTAYYEGCLNVMGELGLIERKIPASRIETVVEDDRDQSGYMQIQNQSPVDGFFEPAVALNQKVRPGDLLGIVTDALGEHQVEVKSTQSGIILTLRVFSRVKKGDSLAVVLET